MAAFVNGPGSVSDVCGGLSNSINGLVGSPRGITSDRFGAGTILTQPNCRMRRPTRLHPACCT